MPISIKVAGTSWKIRIREKKPIKREIKKPLSEVEAALAAKADDVQVNKAMNELRRMFFMLASMYKLVS